MDGFYLMKKNTSIEKVKQHSTELSLLAKGEGTEIMLQKIQPQKIISVSPSDREETMEFFYVLKGTLLWEKEKENILLEEGDYIYTNKLQETVYFKTLDEVELLYASTQPIFHFASNKIKELMDIVEKVEKKDRYTYNHGSRVQEYSIKIAEKIHLSRDKLEDLLFASLFHDIGKIHVPDEILNKPGSLTNEEFEFIKKHPIDGEKLVKATFLANIGKVIAQHHERLDGSGYPFGLKGNEICIEAKIIALADAYDAMTSDRTYRGAMTSENAVEELNKYSGKQFDNTLVNIFIDILKEEGKL